MHQMHNLLIQWKCSFISSKTTWKKILHLRNDLAEANITFSNVKVFGVFFLQVMLILICSIEYLLRDALLMPMVRGVTRLL